MDNYDKLCEAAQLEWTPKVGDRFVVKHALYLEATKDNDIKFTTEKQENQYPYYEENIEYVIGDEGFGTVFFHDIWIFAGESLKPFTIWLPSIEQVNEMFIEKLGTLEPFVHGFYIFIMKRKFGSPIKYYSYRELHLMYYCYYFKNLLWDGETFIELEDSIEKWHWGG